MYDPTVVEAQTAVLRSGEAHARKAAIKVLGQFVDARVAEILALALNDEDNALRAAAAKALERLGYVAVEPLMAALKDSDSAIRWQAAEILGKIRDPRAIDPLSALCNDADENVRSAAKKATEYISASQSLHCATAAGKPDVLHNAERIPHLVEAIFDEYFQRMQLADQYQREIDATGGWTHMGGSDNIRRQLEKIKSANLAASSRAAILRIGSASVPEVLKSLAQFEDRTADWHASSRAGLAQFLIQLLERLDPVAAESQLSILRRYA